MKTNKLIIIGAVTFMGLWIACKKENTTMEPGTTSFSVRMTDAPANIYTAVNIDIQGVQVITEGGANIALNVYPGVYDLLNYTNGKDTLIATAMIPTGTVSQIRLILGNNNTVELNGQTYPLKTPSAQQSGLKLNLHAQLIGGVAYILKIDFDANQSIVQEGNGDFLLKPVIKVIDYAITGSIHGVVVTTAALPATVTVAAGMDIVSSQTSSDGQFLITALPPGSYSVTFIPLSPFAAKAINNIIVTTAHVTEVGQITF